MAYCAPRGIPHGVFLSEWQPEDQAKAIAWQEEEQLRCLGCGTAAWEWDPKLGGSRTAYTPIKLTCEGCNRKAHAEDADDPKGTYVTLVRSEVAVQMAMGAAAR